MPRQAGLIQNQWETVVGVYDGRVRIRQTRSGRDVTIDVIPELAKELARHIVGAAKQIADDEAE